MIKTEALHIATAHNIPLGVDFHTLASDVVHRILDAADARKYRKPKTANGSRARYFYAMLNRANNAKVPEYVVQGNYGFGHGWEDVCSETKYSEARERLKEYRENQPGPYRLITRRVPG